MGDTEDDISGLGREILRTAGVDGLRQRMDAFVEAHDSDADLRELRAAAGSGTSMSRIVDDGRDEPTEHI